jgi:hypothetical protein
MDTFTVYLFVRDRSRTHSAASLQQRLAAQQALREELLSTGSVRVTALPYEADLQVEITNVVDTYERPTGVTARGEAHRVLIIRLLIGDEPVEFVCSDGIGNMPAERHAARRVLVWLNNLATYQNRAERTLATGFTLNLSAN